MSQSQVEMENQVPELRDSVTSPTEEARFKDLEESREHEEGGGLRAQDRSWGQGGRVGPFRLDALGRMDVSWLLLVFERRWATWKERKDQVQGRDRARVKVSLKCCWVPGTRHSKGSLGSGARFLRTCR